MVGRSLRQMSFLKHLVDYTKRIFSNQRGEILTASAMAALPYALAGLGMGGLGAWSIFGGGEKKKTLEDPLAGIRAQLQSLSGEIPGMVEKRKELLRQQFGATREQGLEDIGEEYQAGRGFAPMSSMERGARGDWMDKIARSLASEELGAEEWGVGQQRATLSAAMGAPGQYVEEPPSFGEQLLGTYGQMAGQSLGMIQLKDLFGDKNKTDLLAGRTPYVKTTSPVSLDELMAQRALTGGIAG